MRHLPQDPSAPARAAVPSTVDVLIIGAGMSGLCVAAKLRESGNDAFLVLEKAGGIGGTWRDNTYPGCACDIPAHLYSLSFEPNADWSRMFAPQAEILAYLRRLVASRGLADRIRCGQTVRSATWDEVTATWRVETAEGARYRARALVSALGALHHAKWPSIAGLDTFRGECFHSASWNHDYDLAGKRVAVIGTGASAIQFVPRIVDRVARLHVFQRTPPWILPKADPAFDERHRWRFRHLPFHRRWFRSRLFWLHEKRVHGFIGGGDSDLSGKMEKLGRELLRRQVDDPHLRARLTPDYAIGCKRLLISSHWYPALQKPNVELVTDEIREVRGHTIVTAGGAAREVDAILFGTGFDTQGNLGRLDVRGVGGVRLARRWGQSSDAYLGTMVAGFPNLFVMLGPNSGLAHNSQIFMIEAQTRLVLAALSALRRRRAAAIEVRDAVQTAYNDDLQARLAATVWQSGGCSNWYQDQAGRNTINWPGTSLEFWWRTARLRVADFRFHRTPAQAVENAAETAKESAT